MSEVGHSLLTAASSSVEVHKSALLFSKLITLTAACFSSFPLAVFCRSDVVVA